MLHLFISSIVAMVFALTPWTLMAQDIDMKRAEALIKKYTTVVERPKSCPLESKKYSDLIAKTEAIKGVLKSNCMDKEGDKMSEVLASIKEIQDELKTKNMVSSSSSSVGNLLGSLTNSDSTSTSAAGGTTAGNTNALSGLKFSALFSNITTMFKKNQCNMEDGRVLEMTADLIYDSTQLGVLAGNELGLIVAGGGFLISSALRLIDLIFKQRFDFEKTADRQSFIKLNCSFYEIRRELDQHGVFDVENNYSREDYRDAKAITESLIKEIKNLEERKVNISKTHEQMDKKTFEENVGNLDSFKKTLLKVKTYLQSGINTNSEIPSETQKLLMISKLSQDHGSLLTQLNSYRSLGLSSIPMLDDLFVMELNAFDSLNTAVFGQTLNISAKDFNENHRAKILFHIIRISDDINVKENKLAEKNNGVKKELGESIEKSKVELQSKLIEMQKVENRLGNLVSPKEYSGLDDGSENLVAILDNHQKISTQIYGEWGEKFLKFTTIKSHDEAADFSDKMARFKLRYEQVLNKKHNEKLPITYVCQDAQRLRLIYKHADSLVQEGFDFIVTNKDIIHTDVKNYYNRSLNEESNPGSTSSAVEKIQRHYKSAVLALKKLKGEEISKEDENMYLTKTFLGNNFIGKSMLEVSAAKKEAKNIQDIYDKLECQRSLVEELN